MLATAAVAAAAVAAADGDAVVEWSPLKAYVLERSKAVPEETQCTVLEMALKQVVVAAGSVGIHKVGPPKWEQFAAKRGIKPKTREQRRMRSQKFNEETGQWEKTWGFNKDGRIDRKEKGMVQQDWLVEVDEKKEREEKEARRKAKIGKGKKK
ncbi:hypothetical protein NUW58_g9458 [Xylaria curta]|uniref:Uncharacterized protein n=1 Tax=Xylaria curta TaxID=42375 RepID=A0ACC1MXP6_9PEZI|nr:hypothetical protein NUW58_g9458 [Xylaria curta]